MEEDVIDPKLPFTLLRATAINDNAQIVLISAVSPGITRIYSRVSRAELLDLLNVWTSPPRLSNDVT